MKSLKKIRNLELDLDFNVTNMIAEMKSLKVLQFHNNMIHTFTNLMEMCDDRELGFEIKPGYIARLSLGQIMYLRKTCPGVIHRIPAKRIYNFEPDSVNLNPL